jgi:hypothetical protein
MLLISAHVKSILVHFIPFESMLNELFMAANIPSRVCDVKNESRGIFLFSLKSLGKFSSFRLLSYSAHLLTEEEKNMKNYTWK